MSKKVIQISSSIASGIGVIISVILTTISIKNGYNTVRINGLDDFVVKLIGVPIYTITKEGEKLVGKGNYFLIVLIGITFSIILTGITLLVELLIYKKKRKKQDELHQN